MKRRILPYHFLVVAASLAAMVLAKINKLDFYHHYFRVIEEVEMRNSQEILMASPVVKWEAATMEGFLSTAAQWLIALIAPAVLLWIALAPTPTRNWEWNPPRAGSRLFLRLHPIHGP